MKIRGLHQKRGWWYYQPPMKKGVRPVAIALRTQDRAEALRLYESLSRRDAIERKDGLFKAEVERYLDLQSSRKKHTAKTSKETRKCLNRLGQFLGERTMVGDITRDRIQRWLDQLGKTNSRSSVRSYGSTIRGFFTWAVKEGLILANPVSFEDLPKATTRAEKYCTKEQRDLLLSTPGRKDVELILWLGFFAGLRLGEILEARLDWVDLNGGVINVRPSRTWTPKGKRKRTIRLGPRLVAYLEGYLAEWPTLPNKRKTDYLLRPDKTIGEKEVRFDPRRPFKDHCAANGLGWVGFHTLRHTFASLHAIAGTPLSVIARELGDDHATVFRHYVGVSSHEAHSGATD